jgi:hypothetical protein
MCWGLEVPSHWLPIIDELCDAMTNCGYVQYCNGVKGGVNFPQVVADQVKEKYNSLRFYYHLEYQQENIPDDIVSQNHAYIDGMIAYAENRVYRMEKENETN